MNVDAEDLRGYAEHGSEEAFQRLVQRHVGLVYSVALRRVGGEHALAEEISQMVFLDVARRAGSFSQNVVLAGWLHRHTCFVASSTVRRESRRREREKKATEMNLGEAKESNSWDWIAPILDSAINRLSGSDRTALLLRFYEDRELSEVAQTLGVTEAAAQKRISRALERLRNHISGRGGSLGISSTGLASILSSQAVSAVPAHVAQVVAASAIAGAGTVGATTIFTQLLAMTTMTKIKAGAAGALIIGMAVPLGVQQQSLKELRTKNTELQAQAVQLEELQELRRENQQLKENRSNLSLTGNELSELLRLRNEVGLLRRATNEIASLKRTKEKPGQQVAATQPTDIDAEQVQLAKTVILDPRAEVQKKLTALRVLRSADARSDDIVREMVLAYYATEDHEARADIFRQLHGVRTPELKRPLVEAIGDPANPAELRQEAAETLDGYVSDPNVIAWLEHIAQNDPDPKVRWQALRSLEPVRLGGGTEEMQ